MTRNPDGDHELDDEAGGNLGAPQELSSAITDGIAPPRRRRNRTIAPGCRARAGPGAVAGGRADRDAIGAARGRLPLVVAPRPEAFDGSRTTPGRANTRRGSTRGRRSSTALPRLRSSLDLADREDDLPAGVSGLQLVRARARHVELRAHAPLTRLLLGRSRSDGDEAEHELAVTRPGADRPRSRIKTACIASPLGVCGVTTT